ncbi:hypothetical protein [Chondrinema litorale]|uniref:hypothetical protein n=1 Tax=Chondrinema litorale TaxID=2994555 RepID=UPI00254323BB|nr:hypothetical protein [Chondrinema litorale]UZR96143.1 hypothetical protein OQ292_10025 [Chondrinema litorale]
MQKVYILIFSILISQSVLGQDLGVYVFARTPQMASYNFKKANSTFSQGVSSGIGFTHKELFLELGAYILEGDSYGYYSFFGSNLNSVDFGNSIHINTNLFGEVTNIPSQAEQSDSSWIFTSGVSFFPNVQIQQLNVGVPLCLGLAYQDDSLYLNSRFILNLSFSIN